MHSPCGPPLAATSPPARGSSPTLALADRHPLPPRGRAFTLIEMIVTVLIVGVLTAIAALGYGRYVAQTKDTAAEQQLHQVTKYVAAAMANANATDGFTVDDFAAAAARVPTIATTGVSAAGGLTVGPGEASTSLVSVAIDTDDATKAGLALRSPTGKCILGRLHGLTILVGAAQDRAAGTCNGSAALTATITPSGAVTGGGGAGGSGSTDATPAELTAPTGVAVAPGVPESTDARVSWAAVPGVTTYRVFLDGNATAAAEVTATSADLEALPAGAHTVTVAAVRESTQGPPSTGVPFTITVADNDMVAAATKLRTPGPGETLTLTMNPAGASTEPGENTTGDKSRWWKITPTVSATYELTTPPDWYWVHILTAPTVSQPGQQLESVYGNASPYGIPMEAGTTYWIRVSNRMAGANPVTWKLRPAVGNDQISHAATIAALAGGQTFTADKDPATGAQYSSLRATTEPGELAGTTRSMWWKYTPAVSATYKFTTPTDWYRMNVIAAADVTQAGVQGGDAQYGGTAKFGVPMTAGTTYYIRTSTMAQSSAGPFTWSMTPAVSNDQIAAAVTIPPTALTDGAVWASGNDPVTGATYNSAAATRETGEADGGQSVWFKFTPTVTTYYTLGMPGSWYRVNVLTSPDVTQVGDMYQNMDAASYRFKMTAGTTYWIRLANTQSQGGPFVLTLKGEEPATNESWTATGASCCGLGPNNLVDGNLQSAWVTANRVGQPAGAASVPGNTVYLTAATPVRISGYKLAAPGNALVAAPLRFRLEASSDGGSSWTELDRRDNQTGWASGQMRAFTLASPVTVSRLRLVIEASGNGAEAWVAEWSPVLAPAS